MEAELAALVSSGATTIVGLMATDLWAGTRERIGRLFARGGDPAAVGAELEASRSDLVAARESGDEAMVADMETEWRSRLRRVLQADPAAAADLRALLEEVGSELEATGGSVVHNSISGGVQHGPVIQAHTVNGGLTFHTGAASAPDSGPARG